MRRAAVRYDRGGVILLSSVKLRMRLRGGGRGDTVSLELEPRSVYQFAGAARSDWEHSIPPAKTLRYSVTFRTLRDQRAVTPRAGRTA